ncbi:dihydrofolate reductase [Demequina capsici]|uniref:Dihydrofolate reductase n=1 Tax=Demequina capsici TaxID=3075620 RepID=A0AA96JF04_9MICO|nr:MULTISPECIES: dihydrofolate reductase [unclassified Demequina]WNM23387.1 dihydrofolate reductase [Demequina sp. OYTSA14]WNM26264.1 dihydrofolate reductase [Demequina sp. PMTSA13]
MSEDRAAIHAIWAQARDRAGRPVIGLDGGMPWHLPGDLARFQSLTHGAAVIMGRHTWESLPDRFRPLPDRFNIVVTSHEAPHGAASASSLPAALELAEAEDPGTDVWVMGGARLFAESLFVADTIEVTMIDLEVEGDTFAPVLSPTTWEVVAESGTQTDGDGPSYRFVTYHRRA